MSQVVCDDRGLLNLLGMDEKFEKGMGKSDDACLLGLCLMVLKGEESYLRCSPLNNKRHIASNKAVKPWDA